VLLALPGVLLLLLLLLFEFGRDVDFAGSDLLLSGHFAWLKLHVACAFFFAAADLSAIDEVFAPEVFL